MISISSGIKAASSRSSSLFRAAKLSLSSWTAKPSGQVGTAEFKVDFIDTATGKIVSPWHDVPLRNGQYFNFINEIPKYSKVKMEISTKKANNPISQDIKNGKLREYHGPIYWNYGALPQTWEDPNVVHPEIKCIGDNDPIDVVEIGSKQLEVGSIVKVRQYGYI
jgi:inorganic pyrophosphatase